MGGYNGFTTIPDVECYNDEISQWFDFNLLS